MAGRGWRTPAISRVRQMSDLARVPELRSERATRVSNVIFDIGGVLLEWNPAKILADFYADPELRGLLRNSLFHHPEWRALDRGELGESELIARVGARTGRPPAELAELLAAARESLVIKADTVELLQSLRGKAGLYCLSNMSVPVYRQLRERHDFWEAFDGIVISGDVMLLKPEREIYEYLLRRYALRAHETVFIDDVAENVDGARAAGLQAIHFSGAADCARRLQAMLFGAPPERAPG